MSALAVARVVENKIYIQIIFYEICLWDQIAILMWNNNKIYIMRNKIYVEVQDLCLKLNSGIDSSIKCLYVQDLKLIRHLSLAFLSPFHPICPTARGIEPHLCAVYRMDASVLLNCSHVINLKWKLRHPELIKKDC